MAWLVCVWACCDVPLAFAFARTRNHFARRLLVLLTAFSTRRRLGSSALPLCAKVGSPHTFMSSLNSILASGVQRSMRSGRQRRGAAPAGRPAGGRAGVIMVYRDTFSMCCTASIVDASRTASWKEREDERGRWCHHARAARAAPAGASKPCDGGDPRGTSSKKAAGRRGCAARSHRDSHGGPRVPEGALGEGRGREGVGAKTSEHASWLRWSGLDEMKGANWRWRQLHIQASGKKRREEKTLVGPVCDAVADWSSGFATIVETSRPSAIIDPSPLSCPSPLS